MAERLDQLEALGIELPEARAREAALVDPTRRSDWATVESLSRETLTLIAGSIGPALEAKRTELARIGEQLVRAGATVKDDIPDRLRSLASAPSGDAGWEGLAASLASLDAELKTAGARLADGARIRADRYVAWAAPEGDAPAPLGPALDEALAPIRVGEVDAGLAGVNALLRRVAPGGAARRDQVREASAAIAAAARELGVPTEPLEDARRVDESAPALDWPTTVEAIEAADDELAGALRERVGQVMESLVRTLESLKEYDVDPTATLVTLEDLRGRLGGAGPGDLPTLLRDARAATEEPVVGVVAGLLDSVRPKLVEVRRLGRDASDVFTAMNRAREALRLKIYSEALAASQEAMDRVTQLTADLDGARSESASLREMLERLEAAHFGTGAFREELDEVTRLLDRAELAPARELLAKTVQRLGGETITYFSERFATLERAFALAKERGFLPDGIDDTMARARDGLDRGRIAEAAELAAVAEASVRAAAGPYVARRVEELESGFREIPDPSLVAPVQRLLADADVTLRVKGDLPGSLDSLRRAEREFAAVFASHASTLVEMLEEERKVLEAMGGTGDEIQRQIDEVQQIFNMGDFVKASRTSQEIRTRAQQQQLVRSEEAVSHAKLALVELGKMGLDAGPLRGQLDTAADACREQRYAEGYRGANGVLAEATRVKATAQRVLDGIADATELWTTLKRSGVAVDAYRDQLRVARTAYQALEFDAALAAVGELTRALETARDEAEARRLRGELRLLREDAHRLALIADPAESTSDPVEDALKAGRAHDAVEAARAAHRDLTTLLRPVLSEHLRSLEQDVEVAHATGLDVPEVDERLGDARRRLALPVPTGVAELLERARADLVESRGFLEHAERVARRAREAVKEAELVRVDVASAQPRLEQIDAALARRGYAQVIEIATALEREMLQATSQQVTRTLASFQATLARARHEGTDTAVAENFLRQARVALEEGHPVEAIRTASRSESELERSELQLRIAQGALQTIQKNLEQAAAEGVRSPTADAGVAAARTAFEAREYGGVLERAMDVGDALQLARDGFRRSRDALDSADRQLKTALEQGADARDVMGRLDEARRAHAEGDYGRSTGLARDAAEGARWSVERLYSATLSDVRAILDTAVSAGLGDRIDPVRSSIQEAEVALQAREWSRARGALDRARAQAEAGLDALVAEREGHLRERYAREPEETPAEMTARGEFGRRLTDERARGGFAAALTILAAEEARLGGLARARLERRHAELKDRLWVGEKLGLDTTPAMELFSEAGLALEAGRLEGIDDLLGRADAQLESLVRRRLGEKFEEIQTELNFSREGLHVAVDSIGADLRRVTELRSDGQTIAAARALLDAADELNRRKSLHRELMNIHYLVDAALARATERRLDTTAARGLLEESIRARDTDYALALAKAREALQFLQSALKGSATPTGFYAIRRPPGGP